MEVRSPKEAIAAREEFLKKTKRVRRHGRRTRRSYKTGSGKKIHDVMETEYGVSALHAEMGSEVIEIEPVVLREWMKGWW